MRYGCFIQASRRGKRGHRHSSALSAQACDERTRDLFRGIAVSAGDMASSVKNLAEQIEALRGWIRVRRLDALAELDR